MFRSKACGVSAIVSKVKFLLLITGLLLETVTRNSFVLTPYVFSAVTPTV